MQAWAWDGLNPTNDDEKWILDTEENLHQLLERRPRPVEFMYSSTVDFLEDHTNVSVSSTWLAHCTYWRHSPQPLKGELMGITAAVAKIDWNDVAQRTQDRLRETWDTLLGNEKPHHIIINIQAADLKKLLEADASEGKMIRLAVPNDRQLPPVIHLGIAFVTGGVLL